ncbi:MAG TPA: tetratricopeptide repeat protein [Dongiaceae bacterium]
MASFLVLLMAGTALVPLAATPAAADGNSGQWSIAGAFLAGMNAKARGDMKVAAELLPLALAANPGDPGLIQATLYALISNGQVPDGIKLAKKLRDERPSVAALAPLVTVLLTQDAIKQGQYDRALELARKLPDQQIGKYAGPMMRAWLIAGSKKQLSPALKELQVLDSEPGFAPFALMQRAAIEDYLGHPDDAAKSYKAAADAANTIPTLLLQLYGNLLLRQGDKDGLNKLMDRFQTENAGNSDAIAGPLLKALSASGKPKPLATTPAEGIAGVMSGMSVLLMQENIFSEALLFARLSLDLKPNLDMAKVLAGDIYRRTDRLDDAVAIYRSIDSTSIYYWSSQLSIAESLRRQDKNDEAEKLLRQMTASDKKNVEAPVLLGDLLRSTNKFDAAAEAYSTAIDRIANPLPNDWSIFYFRGTSYERAKQWPKAEADFKKALELSPDQPYVLNYLAYTWVERREHLDEALKMLQTAVDARPEEGFIVDSLGWAHFQLGHFQDAVKYLERAVALSPQDPTLNDHLGDAYWRAGRHVEARFQWSRALSFKPEADQVKVIETKVRDGMAPLETNPAPGGNNNGAGGQNGGQNDGQGTAVKQNAG